MGIDGSESESRGRLLESALQNLYWMLQKDVWDDQDVLNLKYIAIWAVTELSHLMHGTGR